MDAQRALTTALTKLHENTGLRLELVDGQMREPQGYAVDAFVRLLHGEVERVFAVECKAKVSKETVGAVMHYLGQLPEKGMFIAEYIPAAVGDQLRANGIPFLDAAGNAFINEAPVYVDIRGQKPLTRAWSDQLRGAAYRPTGLQVLFGFLCEPALVNEPYRAIAQKVGVAHGTVGWVMRDLRELGFLLTLGPKKNRLVEREKLLRVWVEQYAATFRPKLKLGRYKVEDRARLEKVKLRDYRAMWGGEPAAAELTKELNPGMWTIYMHDDPRKFILLNALKEDRDGNVELLKAFWPPEFTRGATQVVPPILVYADLLASGEGRNLEIAQVLYEQIRAGLVRND